MERSYNIDNIKRLQNAMEILTPYDKNIMTRNEIEELFDLCNRRHHYSYNEKPMNFNTLVAYNLFTIDHVDTFEKQLDDEKVMYYVVDLFDSENNLVRTEKYESNYQAREKINRIRETAQFFIPNARVDVREEYDVRKIQCKRNYYLINIELFKTELDKRIAHNQRQYCKQVENLQDELDLIKRKMNALNY